MNRIFVDQLSIGQNQAELQQGVWKQCQADLKLPAPVAPNGEQALPASCIEALKTQRETQQLKEEQQTKQKSEQDQERSATEAALRRYYEYVRSRSLVLIAIGLCFLAALSINALIQTTIQNASPDQTSTTGIWIVFASQLAFCIALIASIIAVALVLSRKNQSLLGMSEENVRYVLVKPDQWRPAAESVPTSQMSPSNSSSSSSAL